MSGNQVILKWETSFALHVPVSCLFQLQQATLNKHYNFSGRKLYSNSAQWDLSHRKSKSKILMRGFLMTNSFTSPEKSARDSQIALTSSLQNVFIIFSFYSERKCETIFTVMVTFSRLGEWCRNVSPMFSNTLLNTQYFKTDELFSAVSVSCL